MPLQFQELIEKILESESALVNHISVTTLFSQTISKKKLLHERILLAVSQKYHKVSGFTSLFLTKKI